jgi:hypothetical protein
MMIVLGTRKNPMLRVIGLVSSVASLAVSLSAMNRPSFSACARH